MDGALNAPGILYLHGFCSSPASWKAALLGRTLADAGLGAHYTCPALSPVPDEALAQGAALIEASGRPLTLVGSSLGGHYASVLAERYDLPAVLINPATVDMLDVQKFVGEHANFHSGERFTFTEAHAAQLKAQVARPTPARYWLLLEEADEVLDCRQAQAFYAGSRCTLLPGGDHSFTRFPEFVPQIIEFAGLKL